MKTVIWALALASSSAADVPKIPICLIDYADDRQLTNEICSASSGLCQYLTREICAKECRKAGFSIAGVEAGHECACGNSLSSPDSLVDISECNTPCTGNFSETCGASLRMLAFDPSSVPAPPPPADDPLLDARHIINGDDMFIGGYSCQPYCSVMTDDSWSCVMTLIEDSPYEGGPGQKMVALQTSDFGSTWSEMVDIDTDYNLQNTSNAAAYGSIVANKETGRVFSLWVQNVNGVDHKPGDEPDPAGFRADMLGDFVWKYSDDNGESWSEEKFTIPVPRTYIESVNDWSEMNGGKNNSNNTQIMWEVDQIKTLKNGTVIFAFTKIATYAVAPAEEIYIMASHNLLTMEDPEEVEWVMWPEGWHGVRLNGFEDSFSDNAIIEEFHVLAINEETQLYMIFRNTLGYVGEVYSQINNWAAEWGETSFCKYAQPSWTKDVQGNMLKNPRGPISPVQQPNGMILMTYDNTEMLTAFAAVAPVSDRNMIWLTAGKENEMGEIRWTQPELALYDRERTKWHGYADVITSHEGLVFISETYKGPPESEARTHQVPKDLLDSLYGQLTNFEICQVGLVGQFDNSHRDVGLFALPSNIDAFNFMAYPKERYGFTFDTRVTGGEAEELLVKMNNFIGGSFEVPTMLVDGRDEDGVGVTVTQYLNGTAEVSMVDGNGMFEAFQTDPTCSAQLSTKGVHQLALTVDGGPKLITWMVDGKLCDGGKIDRSVYVDNEWPNGHSLFDPRMGDVSGVRGFVVGDSVESGRFYDKVLFVSELIGNWNYDDMRD